MRAPRSSRRALVTVALVATVILEAAPSPAGAGPGSPSTPTLAPDGGQVITPGFFFAAPGVSWNRGGSNRAPAGALPLSEAAPLTRRPVEWHEFYFTRAMYTSFGGGRGWGGRGRGSWAVDYPEADRHFAEVIERVVGLDAYDYENAVSLADPELRKYPILYALEVGRMALTQEEVHGLRDYLNAGGFLIIDDFWGTREWEVFEYNMRMVLPGRLIVELEKDHPIFRIFYEIDEVLQVPNVRQGYYGGPTWEKDGYDPYVLGIFDDHGRLMVVINWNTDLGDAWEWSDDPFYPMKYSTFAYEMGANFIVYGMSH